MKRLAIAACNVGAAGYVLVALLAFVPFFPCTMLEHFRVHYVLVAPMVIAIAWFAPRFFDAVVIAMLVNFGIVAPDLQRTIEPKAGEHVRLVFFNVHASNTEHARVAALIAETRPDVLALVETNQRWFDALAPTVAGYRKLEHGRSDNFGLALYARGTLTGSVHILDGELPTIIAEVVVDRVGGGPKMTVVVTHPWPPVNTWTLDQQRKHLAALATKIAALPRPVVLAGDLNATPWSREFAKLVGATALCDTRAGFGYQGSFPASSAIVRIPIDHVLVSCSIGVHDRWIGPDAGSDHLPVIVDLVF